MQARGGGVGELMTVAQDGVVGFLFELQSDRSCEAHRAQHAHRVLDIALVGVADAVQAAATDVVHGPGVVDEREGLDVVEQRVDREVAAQRILLGGAVLVVAHHQAVLDLCVIRLAGRIGAEGGDLDHLLAEHDVRQPEAAPDDPAVAEGAADLLGAGVGRHVEVLGDAPQQQVADASTRQIGGVTGLAQAVENFEGLGADVLAADGVLFAGNDGRLHEAVIHTQAERGIQRENENMAMRAAAARHITFRGGWRQLPDQHLRHGAAVPDNARIGVALGAGIPARLDPVGQGAGLCMGYARAKILECGQTRKAIRLIAQKRNLSS